MCCHVSVVPLIYLVYMHATLNRNKNISDLCLFNISQTFRDPIMCVCVCVPMPTHCTITRFGFHARCIHLGIKCGLFFNHAPLGQTILRVGRVSVLEKVEVRVTVSVTV